MYHDNVFGICDLTCGVSEKGNTTTADTVGAGVSDKVVVITLIRASMMTGVTLSRTLSHVSVSALMLNVLEVMYWEIISMLEMRGLQLMRQAVIELVLLVASHVDLSCILSLFMYSLTYFVESVIWLSVGVGGFDF